MATYPRKHPRFGRRLQCLLAPALKGHECLGVERNAPGLAALRGAAGDREPFVLEIYVAPLQVKELASAQARIQGGEHQRAQVINVFGRAQRQRRPTTGQASFIRDA